MKRRSRAKGTAGKPGQLERLEAENQELRARIATLEGMPAATDVGLLANLSHEIRTPLNGILGLLQLVHDQDVPESLRDDLATVRKSAEQLLVLVNNTLDFARIGSGKLQLEAVDFDVVRAVEDVAELLAESAHRKGVEVYCSFAEDVPRCVRGDPGRLRQVLTNLVGNAVKFTTSGEVAVHFSRVPGRGVRLRCEVRDTGIGMTREQLALLFRPFSQADPSTTRRFGGTGLGLAISAQLCRLMDGDITIDSTPGKGSTVRFEITVAAATAADDSGSQLQVLRGRSILVVEPNAALAQVLASCFTAFGMQVTSVDSCEAATGWLLSQPAGKSLPDFVLVDATDVEQTRVFHSWLQTHPAGECWLLLGVPTHLRTTFGTRSGIAPEALLHKPYRRDQLLRRLCSMAAAVAPATTAQQPELRPGLRVLVAEDTPVNQMVTLRTLERLGYEAELAVDGTDAVAKVKSGSFDVVLMDCQMPGMDGFEAARTIRALDTRQSALPIIAMTADGMAGTRERCLSAGMNDYVTKPVKISDLRAALRRWC